MRRHWGWLAVVPLVCLGMTAAEAKQKAGGECPYDFRTGAALPRQAEATLTARLSSQPYPTSDEQRFGGLQPGDQVTVQAECVLWVEVETKDGSSGWAHVAALQSEQRLLEAAGTAASVAGGNPDPCQRYLPTGAPLPREDLVSKDAPLFLLPNPSYRDGPLEMLRGGSRATILKECGQMLRVRSNGVEGWANRVSFDNEPRLAKAALLRPIASADECAIRYDDPQVVRRCETEVSAKLAHREELQGSTYLTGEEMAPLVAGKTFVLIEPDETLATAKDPSYNHFAADGQYYLKTGKGGAGTNYRGRWYIKDSTLCMPKAFQPCYKLLKTPSGTVSWMATFRGTLTEYQGIEDPGSTQRIVAEIERYYPEAPAELPSETDVGIGMAKPALGD